jgi:hypothetical protein
MKFYFRILVKTLIWICFKAIFLLRNLSLVDIETNDFESEIFSAILRAFLI